MYYFYVLYSLKDNRLYKGATSNLLRRLQQHNAGGTRSTKHRRPLILLYFEEYAEQSPPRYHESAGRSHWRAVLLCGSY
ncbi:GIY-YIG nuclease family protein [Phaeodactylibacter xiamenensis]|uniref:GIY-YIG nuclease family protein n=1 Tax=Phaeodactylibacter xiamenensis TaxID=1524460 RepID=UPI003CCB8E7E